MKITKECVVCYRQISSHNFLSHVNSCTKYTCLNCETIYFGTKGHENKITGSKFCSNKCKNAYGKTEQSKKKTSDTLKLVNANKTKEAYEYTCEKCKNYL